MNTRQRRNVKKISSILLTFCMVLTLLPTAGLAEGVEPNEVELQEDSNLLLEENLEMELGEEVLEEEVLETEANEEDLEPLPLDPELENDTLEPITESQSTTLESDSELSTMTTADFDISTENLTLTEEDGITYYNGQPYTDSITITGTTASNTIIVSSGTHNVTLNSVDITSNVASPFNITSGSTVNLTLADNTTNLLSSGATSQAGLQVPFGATLVITSSGNGILNATGGTSGMNGGAGIGSETGEAGETSGTITINGGEINATGGFAGAGIGGGYNVAGGTITINGGEINATGGFVGAGIGGGYNGAGGTITINGGTITTTGGMSGAGIGGGQLGASGTITINGGNITAQGEVGGTGIGGGTNGYNVNSMIEINGGIIIASGGSYENIGGAGIGNGASGMDGYVTITGGTITANGGYGGAGIGGGTNGGGNYVVITGGNVQAIGDTTNGAENIGHGLGADFSGFLENDAGTDISLVKISLVGMTTQTEVTGLTNAGNYNTGFKTLGTNELYIYLPDEGINPTEVTAGDIYTGMVTYDTQGNRSGEFMLSRELDVNNGNITLSNSSGTNYYKQGANQATSYTGNIILTGTTTEHTVSVISGTHNVTLNSAGITSTETSDASPFSINSGGTVNLTLANGSINLLSSGTDYAGLQVQYGATLVITSFGSGTLNAIGEKNGAGIGSKREEASGNIIINGGNITAINKGNASGIGGGYNVIGGTIEINGGTITATGGPYGAGIGGGQLGAVNDITINGGIIIANGGTGGGAGIGSGESGDICNITINGGIITANGMDGGAGIGGGSGEAGGNININGGTIATNGGMDGAGIGGGFFKPGGNININGGIITANGMGDGAGIGGGFKGAGGNININGGTIATNGGTGGAGIGGGKNGAGGTVKITGGNIQASSITSTPTNSSGSIELALVTITLDGVTQPTAVRSILNSSGTPIEYNLKDIKTTSSGKLLIYLDKEATPSPAAVNAANLKYIGSFIDKNDRTKIFTQGMSLDYVTLNLTENLNLIYTATISSDYTNPYMTFTFKETTSNNIYGTPNSSGGYDFRFRGITPQYMIDGVDATLYATNSTGNQVSLYYPGYTIKTYGQNMLKNHSSNTTLVSLISDLLNYGTTTQRFRNHKTNNLATKDVQGLDITEFPGVDKTKFSSSGTSDPKGEWIAAGLYLSDSMSMYFDFATNDSNGLSIEATINGRTTTFNSSKFEPSPAYPNDYRIYLHKIMADEFDELVTLEFKYNGEKIGKTLNYSVNSYVYSMQDYPSNAKIKNVVRAIYNYGVSVENYIAANLGV